MHSSITKERQRQEAIKRLRFLEKKGLMPQVRHDFEQGVVNWSERVAIPGFGANGILYWLHESPEFEEIVRSFEEQTGSLVYHVTHEVLEFGELLDLFHVSKHADEWEADEKDLEDGYSLVFAANLSDDWLSELGTIGFQIRGGGLVRTL